QSGRVAKWQSGEVGGNEVPCPSSARRGANIRRRATELAGKGARPRGQRIDWQMARDAPLATSVLPGKPAAHEGSTEVAVGVSDTRRRLGDLSGSCIP